MPPSWTRYAVTQKFGPTSEPLDSGGVNKGWDFATPLGTPIDAVVAGTVEHVGDAGDGWGESVKVRDAQGNLHNYGHLSSVAVRRGQKVSAGMVVGKSGNTGKSSGPHLSYDVSNKAGQFIDPAPFLGQKPAPKQPAKQPRDPNGRPDAGAALRAAVDTVMIGGIGGGPAGAAKGGGVVSRVLRTAKAHPKLTAAGTGLAAWKFDVPFVGGDGEEEPQDVDAEQLARIMQKVARGETLLPEEIGILQSAAPEVAVAYDDDLGSEDGFGADGFAPSIDPEGKSNADILDAILRALVEQGGYDARDVASLATQAQNLRDAEAKRIRLDDGTIITSEMMANADPLTRQQFEMELNRRTTDYENEAIATLNKFALDSYALGRQAVNDANTNANNDYRNRVEAIRQRLDLDEINIEQAGQEMERLLKGMGESRARANLETSTALQAAPFATRGGKTSFTGADLGGSVSGLARIGGVARPETTPLIAFPGTQRIDVAGLMAQRDAELGVAGQTLPTAPQISVQTGDLPAPPVLAGGPEPPLLVQPNVLPRIQMPRSSPVAE